MLVEVVGKYLKIEIVSLRMHAMYFKVDLIKNITFTYRKYHRLVYP